MVAEGLKSLLEEEFELAGIVEDGRAMVKAARELRPDVIVADISMPLLNGIDALVAAQAGRPGRARRVPDDASRCRLRAARAARRAPPASC